MTGPPPTGPPTGPPIGPPIGPPPAGPGPTFDAQGVRAGLTFILWGGLIVIVDVAMNGFDLVNDWIGWALVWWGLARILIATRSSPSRAWLWAVVGLSLLYAPLSATPAGDPNPPPGAGTFLLGVLGLLGALCFCAGLRSLTSGDQRLAEVHHSWHRSLWLIALLWGVPEIVIIAVFRADPLSVGQLTSESLAVVVPLLVAASLAALVHMALSTLRTRRALADFADYDDAGRPTWHSSG